MWKREQWRAFVDQPWVEWGMLALGVILMVLSPLVAYSWTGRHIPLRDRPGAGLENEQWAKRRYVHFKRWQPKVGRWADWGSRRRSAKRREALRRNGRNWAALRSPRN
jgi:hypothetical protein